MTTFYRPELLFADGNFTADAGLLVRDDGRIALRLSRQKGGRRQRAAVRQAVTPSKSRSRSRA